MDEGRRGAGRGSVEKRGEGRIGSVIWKVALSGTVCGTKWKVTAHGPSPIRVLCTATWTYLVATAEVLPLIHYSELFCHLVNEIEGILFCLID
jgi:hypothetical protein